MITVVPFVPCNTVLCGNVSTVSGTESRTGFSRRSNRKTISDATYKAYRSCRVRSKGTTGIGAENSRNCHIALTTMNPYLSIKSARTGIANITGDIKATAVVVVVARSSAFVFVECIYIKDTALSKSDKTVNKKGIVIGAGGDMNVDDVGKKLGDSRQRFAHGFVRRRFTTVTVIVVAGGRNVDFHWTGGDETAWNAPAGVAFHGQFDKTFAHSILLYSLWVFGLPLAKGPV